MKDKTYNVLKYIAQIVLPGMATLWLTLVSIWKFPYGQQIAHTIAAINTFLGVLLGISSVNYKKKVDE